MPRKLTVCCALALLSLAMIAQRVQASDLACLTCHSAPGFTEPARDGKEKSLYVNSEALASSVHGGMKCLDCHVDFAGQTAPHKLHADPVQCALCHHNDNHVGASAASYVDKYSDSVHGNALHGGSPDAPDCKSCHGTHGIKPASDPTSATYRGNIPKTCGQCHFDPGFAKRHKLPSVKNYTDSVHAKAMEGKDGMMVAAVCTDCHGVHDITAPGHIGSSVGRARVPETCGKCHREVLTEYEGSIHGKAAARGVKSAPVCTDCHGEHLISRPSNPASPVYPTRVAATCSKCHEDAKIQRKFGLPAGRLSSYISSYHGVANKYGDVTVANCATCHGAHNVLPSSDPKSTVNKKNIPATCGKCHPGAGANFAQGSIHVLPTPKQDPIVFWVRSFYMLFVVGLIGSFVGYIMLDLRARWIGRLPWRRGGHSR
jgi:hypothetical protein